MIEIKPDEISSILRQQLSNFNQSADLEEIGTVLQVGDGIARVYACRVRKRCTCYCPKLRRR
jgi:F-type H+/Na+-transporting ATPase subunit alpha